MKRWLPLLLLFAIGCTSATTTSTTTSAPPPQPAPPVLAGMSDTHGTAGWYGQEFAGRTTANGEIFDPLLMTAAHRTLPFGTVIDVKNPKTQQTVRVRVNDRGPYIGNRLIDLSYAAAQQIGIVDTGGGEVDINVVRLGKGEREPPAPYTVAVAGPTASGEAPKVEATPAPPPAPAPAPAPVVVTPLPPVPVTVGNVQVIEEHKGVETRRQVSASGKSVEVVPVPQPKASAPAPAPVQPAPQPKPVAPAPSPAPAKTGRYAVQVGAFSIEANAKALQERLTKLGEQASIQKTTLYLVRIGPFETRDQALKVRERLEREGISAIIVTM